MKRVIFAILLLSITCLMLAQAARDEAIQSLETARDLLEHQSYVKAQDEINFALAKVNELLAAELLKFIPDAPEGWRRESANAAGLGQMGAFMGSANAITASADYYKGDTHIQLTLSSGGILGKTASLAALGQMYGKATEQGSKTIRIAGYTGTSEYEADSQSGNINLQVGEKISIRAEGDNIASTDALKTLIEKIDLAKLEKSF